MVREKRLEEILKLLFQGERFSTKTLALKYNLGERIIQKDLKKLRDNNPLIKREKGEYFIPEENLLQDIQELHPLAMDIVMNIVKKVVPDHSEIIQNSLDIEMNNIFLFDFKIDKIKNEKIFFKLRKALLEEIAIKFNYENREKNLFPLKIANLKSKWYLIGYDLEESKIKLFSINKIKNIIFHQESFLNINLKKKLQKIQIDVKRLF